jgi:hypothetical protein
VRQALGQGNVVPSAKFVLHIDECRNKDLVAVFPGELKLFTRPSFLYIIYVLCCLCWSLHYWLLPAPFVL